MKAANEMSLAEMRNGLTEAEFQRAVISTAKAYGWGPIYHTRYSLGSDAGFPDLVMVRGKRLLFVELKSAKGKVTPEQDRWLTAVMVAGAESFLFRPADWARMEEVLA